MGWAWMMGKAWTMKMQGNYELGLFYIMIFN